MIASSEEEKKEKIGLELSRTIPAIIKSIAAVLTYPNMNIIELYQSDTCSGVLVDDPFDLLPGRTVVSCEEEINFVVLSVCRYVHHEVCLKKTPSNLKLGSEVSPYIPMRLYERSSKVPPHPDLTYLEYLFVLYIDKIGYLPSTQYTVWCFPNNDPSIIHQRRLRLFHTTTPKYRSPKQNMCHERWMCAESSK